MFYYLMVFFGIILASLNPKRTIIRYLRCHLGLISYNGILASIDPKACITRVALASLVSHFRHLGIFDIFGILASWDSKVHIIRDQRCLGFGIFVLSWCLILGLMMPKCPKCQKCKDAKKDAKTRKWMKAKNAYQTEVPKKG